VTSNLIRAAASAIALIVAAGPALAQDAPRQSTAFTLETDQPRTPEQEAVRFDKADLSIHVLTKAKAIRGVAVLDFTVLAPIERLAVELDTLFEVTEVSVDGVAIERANWSNPEGRKSANARPA